MMTVRQILDVDRLRGKGWSDRSIARHLSLDLTAVRIHLGIATHEEIGPAFPPEAEGPRPKRAAGPRPSPDALAERVRARRRRFAGAAE